MDTCRCYLNAMATLNEVNEMKQFLLEIMLGSNYELGSAEFNTQLNLAEYAKSYGYVQLNPKSYSYTITKKGLDYVSMY